MICNSCGKEIPDNKKFCPYCMMPLIDHTIKSDETDEVTRSDLAKKIKKLEPDFIKIKEKRKQEREEKRKQKEEELKRLAEEAKEIDSDDEDDFDTGTSFSFDEIDHDEKDDLVSSVIDDIFGTDEEHKKQKYHHVHINKYNLIDENEIELYVKIGDIDKAFTIFLYSENEKTNNLFIDFLNMPDLSEIDCTIEVENNIIKSIFDGMLTYNFESP